jgi:hypothetical protein
MYARLVLLFFLFACSCTWIRITDPQPDCDIDLLFKMPEANFKLRVDETSAHGHISGRTDSGFNSSTDLSLTIIVTRVYAS